MTEPAERVLDLRTYKLVAGGAEEFDRIFRERVLPMLERFGIEVVGYGPSLDDGDLYYLMRAFASATQREEQLDAFYGSEEWRQKHREAVLALIETYHTLLVDLAPAMRGGGRPTSSA
ncbi:MAG TPA: NIPSNAP family protein [Gaiellaceae bacterium]